MQFELISHEYVPIFGVAYAYIIIVNNSWCNTTPPGEIALHFVRNNNGMFSNHPSKKFQKLNARIEWDLTLFPMSDK